MSNDIPADRQANAARHTKNEEIIGVAITMGSLSHALQKAKGKLFPLGWYHLVRALKWKKEEKVELLLIAVRPDYQGLG